MSSHTNRYARVLSEAQLQEMEASLRRIAAQWFAHPDPQVRQEREAQFQAFSARFTLEREFGVDISAGSSSS